MINQILSTSVLACNQQKMVVMEQLRDFNIKRGYIPDGKSVTYNYQPAIPGNSYPLDDELVLWLTKKLR